MVNTQYSCKYFTGKTDCSSCHSSNGILCRACLKVRYGEGKWTCSTLLRNVVVELRLYVSCTMLRNAIVLAGLYWPASWILNCFSRDGRSEEEQELDVPSLHWGEGYQEVLDMQQVSFASLTSFYHQRPEMALSELISHHLLVVIFGHTTMQLLLLEEEEDTTDWDCHIQW